MSLGCGPKVSLILPVAKPLFTLINGFLSQHINRPTVDFTLYATAAIFAVCHEPTAVWCGWAQDVSLDNFTSDPEMGGWDLGLGVCIMHYALYTSPIICAFTRYVCLCCPTNSSKPSADGLKTGHFYFTS